jgi:hypothetical protein
LNLCLKIYLSVTTLAPWGAQNQVQSVVGHESSILFQHSYPPMRIGEDGPN